MGGEREFSTPSVKPTAAMGSAPIELGSLRIHENKGEVHFHDDANGRKVAVPVATWFKAADQILSQPTEWVFIDSDNNAQLLAKSYITNGVFDVDLSVQPQAVGDTFRKLQTFTQG